VAGTPSRAVPRQLRRLIARQAGCTMPDAQLLEAFVARGDEASFEVLVWRHAGLVYDVCRRVLRHDHDAEDAFQATFLVFAKKAASIGKGEAVGSWLYKVAYRIALRLRSSAARRAGHEQAGDDLPCREADEAQRRDLRRAVDEEIDRLPEKYRAPLVLCYLQGHTNEEAAAQLGCPRGTILSRLSRARDRLRGRLARRGLAISPAPLAEVAPTAVPSELVISTIEAASAFAAGTAATGLVKASVAALVEGALKSMLFTKLKIAAAALFVLAVVGSGTGFLIHRANAAPATEDRPVVADDRPAAENYVAAQREEEKRPDVAGKVTEVSKDGKTLTVETPGQNRGDEPTKTEIKLNDKTTAIYHGVGLGGAKPAVGYVVRVWAVDGHKDTAQTIIFQGQAGSRGSPPSAEGKIVSVAKDGKSITVETAPRGRTEDAKQVEVKITDKTTAVYHNVGIDGTKLAEGQQVRVYLLKDSKDVAHWLDVAGSGDGGGRRSREDTGGKVLEVSKDGKKITVEQPPKVRGEEPTKIELELGDKTAVTFHNVTAGGAKIAEGMFARVWLEEDSKNKAARVVFAGSAKPREQTIAGPVVATSKDGKTITLEQPPRQRGDDPSKVEIKLTDKTKLAFSGVAPGEAKVAEGLVAMVYLESGSKDTASAVMFAKPGERRR